MRPGLLLSHDQRRPFFGLANHNDLGIRLLARVSVVHAFIAAVWAMPWLRFVENRDALGFQSASIGFLPFFAAKLSPVILSAAA